MTSEKPPFVDDQGQTLVAEYRCDGCGEIVTLLMHPEFLDSLERVREYLNRTAPCACTRSGSVPLWAPE